MARVHHVKKARKDNPAVKAGQPYWWWKTRITVGKSYVGRMRYSATSPKASQTTSSEFGSEYLSIGEDLAAADPEKQDLIDARDDAAQRARGLSEEVRERFENMPEGLQQGDTGQLLEERADGLEAWAEDLEQVDLDEDPDEPEKGTSKEDAEADAQQFWEDKHSDLCDLDPGIY